MLITNAISPGKETCDMCTLVLMKLQREPKQRVKQEVKQEVRQEAKSEWKGRANRDC